MFIQLQSQTPLKPTLSFIYEGLWRHKSSEIGENYFFPYLKKTYRRMIYMFMHCLAVIIRAYLHQIIKLLWLLNENLIVFWWHSVIVTFITIANWCLWFDITIESFQTFKMFKIMFLVFLLCIWKSCAVHGTQLFRAQ